MFHLSFLSALSFLLHKLSSFNIQPWSDASLFESFYWLHFAHVIITLDNLVAKVSGYDPSCNSCSSLLVLSLVLNKSLTFLSLSLDSSHFFSLEGFLLHSHSQPPIPCCAYPLADQFTPTPCKKPSGIPLMVIHRFPPCYTHIVVPPCPWGLGPKPSSGCLKP